MALQDNYWEGEYFDICGIRCYNHATECAYNREGIPHDVYAIGMEVDDKGVDHATSCVMATINYTVEGVIRAAALHKPEGERCRMIGSLPSCDVYWRMTPTSDYRKMHEEFGGSTGRIERLIPPRVTGMAYFSIIFRGEPNGTP